MSIEWLLELDIKYFLIIIILGGGLFALYVIHRQKKQDEMNKQFWAEIKEVTRLYHQVDKLEAVNSLAIRVLSNPNKPIETLKQSADGKGDHAINHDV